jgi:hypothetical protein
MITGGDMAVAQTRTDLSQMTGTGMVWLNEAGREGHFKLDTSDMTAHVAADPNQGIYVAQELGTGAWVRQFDGPVNVKWFGATADGTTDDSAAFVTAIAALKAYNLNKGTVYGGSPKLFVPAGNYYLGSTPLDINHTLMIEGEGSGRAPGSAYGCTHLRWANGVAGIRTQLFRTSGTNTVDGADHDAAGAVYLKNFSMEGGFVATNDDVSDAIVARSLTYLDDLLIRNWSGTGVRSWTGTVLGTGYSGNTSVSRYTGVKVEACKLGFDTRGTDSNVITFTNCEGYQCRQAGFVDDNGAGSNTYIGCHATYNGLTGSLYTQVVTSGNAYVLKWGQETGAATNAPSGTTADNTWWTYFGPASVDATRPAWSSGMSGLAAGGDYVTLSSFPTVLLNCYSEGGGFSQLGNGTLAIAGTNIGLSSSGGTCLVPENDGLALKRIHAGAILHLDGSDGGTNGIDSRGSTGVANGSISWTSNNCGYVAGVGGGHRFSTLTGGVATLSCQIMYYGVDLSAGEAYYINGTQVVGARVTGWAADTGTAEKTAHATYTAGTTLTFSASYTQSELTALATRLAAVETALQNVTRGQKAVKDTLIFHGLAGA